MIRAQRHGVGYSAALGATHGIGSQLLILVVADLFQGEAKAKRRQSGASAAGVYQGVDIWGFLKIGVGLLLDIDNNG